MDKANQPSATPVATHRDEFDAAVLDFKVGQAIRAARESRGLTQAQLGELIGVKKSRLCSIEKGSNLRLSTLRRIFRALGVDAVLSIDGITSIPIK